MLWDVLALLFVTVALGAAFGAVPAHGWASGWMQSRKGRDEPDGVAPPAPVDREAASEPARVISFPAAAPRVDADQRVRRGAA